jgi:hypothetical protein
MFDAVGLNQPFKQSAILCLEAKRFVVGVPDTPNGPVSWRLEMKELAEPVCRRRVTDGDQCH